MFAILDVECSTLVIANVCSNTCSVRFAHTVMGRWRGVLIVPGFQRVIHSFDKRFVLMMCVMEVVMGHGREPFW